MARHSERSRESNGTTAMSGKESIPTSLFALLAMITFFAGCKILALKPASKDATSILAAGALVPSPRLIVGRIIAVDSPQKFAFVELTSDAPQAALIPETELVVRTLELRDTGRLQVSRYLRGRTLGTKIVAGQPSPGDEVVWVAP